MKRHLRNLVLVLVTALLPACVTARPSPSVLGRDVKVVPRANGPTVRGELLAVESDRIVVLTPDAVREIAASQIRQVRVRRHRFDGHKAWTWTLIGAAASGVGLASACSSVDTASGCGGAGVVGATPWLLLGGLSSLAAERSAFVSFDAAQHARLRPFARYPQGLPPEIDLRSLVPPRPSKP